MNGVEVAREVGRRLAAAGLTVYWTAGWDQPSAASQGQVADFKGSLTHHTGAADLDGIGTGPAKIGVLVSGRSDLKGRLCNSAGGEDGSVTIISGYPANHAGASGGRSMGPLPTSGWFNRLVWGHEIDYPGSRPMSAAALRSAQMVAGTVCDVLGVSYEHARAHAETSVTGKWDPGYAPGKTISMADFRGGIPAVLHPTTPAPSNPGGFLMALTDQQQFEVWARVMGYLHQRWYTMVDGQPVECGADKPGAIPARALDTLDGNYLATLVESGNAADAAAFKAQLETSAQFAQQDAARDAALQQGLAGAAATLNAGQVADLVLAQLSPELAKSVADTLAQRLAQ